MSERKTVHKIYWEWDFKKEELWLNEMAQEGWALERANFCTYTFVRCEPGEYIIRMEMNENKGYRNFVESLDKVWMLNALATFSAGFISAVEPNSAPLICFLILIPVRHTLTTSGKRCGSFALPILQSAFPPFPQETGSPRSICSAQHFWHTV